jgi:hypothetical protein
VKWDDLSKSDASIKERFSLSCIICRDSDSELKLCIESSGHSECENVDCETSQSLRPAHEQERIKALFVGCIMQALQLYLDINENLVRRTGERTGR